MKRRSSWVVAVCAATLLAGCGGQGAVDTPIGAGDPSAHAIDPSKQLDPATVAAAKDEGSVTVYGDAQNEIMQPVIAAFNNQFPDIDVSYVYLNPAESFQRYLSESSTGGQTSDVILGTDGVSYLDLVKRGEVLDFTPPAAVGLPEYAKLAPGVFAVEENPAVGVFNKAVLPESEQPKTLAELADMADSGPLTGKLVTYDGTSGFGYMVTQTFVANHDNAWPLLEKLGQNSQTETSAGPMFSKLSQGAAVASYFSSGAIRSVIEAATAQILNLRLYADGTPFVPRGIGITAKGASPNAAKVFSNFMLTEQGQVAACKGGFTPYLAGVECDGFTVDEVTAEFGAENVYFTNWDDALVSSQTEIVSRWKAAFGK
ncbi:ABC transporter substrate-binding protein [Rhodococcus sp. NPDC059968]|uniref:ABC transporter substrate-binding protein n=1 Tax=Rhodococcus sp. NPDC059968 TaxID=3347017 RepID=UPI003671A099